MTASRVMPLDCPVLLLLLLEGPTGGKALAWSPVLKRSNGTLSPRPSPDPEAHIQTWLGLPPLPDPFQLEIQSVSGGLRRGPRSPEIRVGKSQNQHNWGPPKRPQGGGALKVPGPSHYSGDPQELASGQH